MADMVTPKFRAIWAIGIPNYRLKICDILARTWETAFLWPSPISKLNNLNNVRFHFPLNL
jgi:hypothetical protein